MTFILMISLAMIYVSYLARRPIDGLLSSCNRMYSRHETLDNLEVVMDHLGKRRQAISGAGGVGDYLEARVVSFQVYTDNEHWCIGRGSRDDNLLGTAFQVSLQIRQKTLNSIILKNQ